MEIKIEFVIRSQEILRLAKLLKIEKKPQELIKEACTNLKTVKKAWIENREFAGGVIKKLFKNASQIEQIAVSIVPECFCVGAVETAGKIILLGQPIRSQNFPAAIILHEIGHVLLKNSDLESTQIIDEAVCMLIENELYLREGKSLNEIWNKNELDMFHRKALDIALVNGPFFKKSLDKGLLKEFISGIKRNLDIKTLEMVPLAGVLNNIAHSRRKLHL